MNAWRQWFHTVVSLLTVFSMVAGTFAMEPASPAAAESQSTLLFLTAGVYLPVRLGEHAAASKTPEAAPDPVSGGMPATRIALAERTTLYLPLVARQYTPPSPIVTQVDPETGGTLTARQDGVTLAFAPGAVTQTVRVTYTPLPNPQNMPDGHYLVGRAFQLTAQAGAQAVNRFLPQVTTHTVTGPDGSWYTNHIVTNTVVITLTYAEADVTGLDERRLMLHTRPPGGDWQPLLTVVNPQIHVASAPLDHLSEFALLGVTAVPTATWVVLDPEHGGGDPGNQVTSPAEYAIEEKVANLDTANAVRDWLEGCGVNVLMTREDDKLGRGVIWRANFISSTAPHLATTIAFNVKRDRMGYFVGGATGVVDLDKPDDEDFAQVLVHAISNTTQLPGHDVADARTWQGDGLYLPLHVTDTLYAHIEAAYLDSYNDRDKVIDPHLDYIAGGIYNGIIAQLGLTACVPFSGTLSDERHRRTLGVENWARYTGKGVNAVTGNQTRRHSDMFVPGTGLDVEIVRYYNSQTDDVGLFGRGWSSVYDMELDFLDGGVIQVKYADGHRANFTPEGDAYRAEEGVFETLAAQGSGYVLTTPGQVRFTFDGHGVLQTIADEDGNTIKLHYEGSRLARIEDTVGRIFDFETDAAGRVTHVTDPAGRVITYTYGLVSLARTHYLQSLRGPLAPQSANQLLSMTDARNGSTAYEYDPVNGYLDRVTDPEGITYLDNTYGPGGRVGKQNNGNGDDGHWEYDYDNMQATYADNEGNQTTYHFDSRYRVIEEIDAHGYSTKYEYDDQDNLVAITDKRGNTWCYTYSPYDDEPDAPRVRL